MAVVAKEIESDAASCTADSGSVQAKPTELPKGQLAQESQAQGTACGCHSISRAVPRGSFCLPSQGGPGGTAYLIQRGKREGDDVTLLVSKFLPQTVGKHRLFMNRHETRLATV